MTTLTSPASDITLLSVWQTLAETHPDLIALRNPHVDPVLEITFSQLFRQIQWFAAGLQSLDVKPGERIALIADNSPRWMIADLGSMFTGAVNVPRSAVADPQELGYILSHSGSTILIAEDAKTLERIRPFVEELNIRQVILLSDESLEKTLNFGQLLQKGRAQGFVPPTLLRSQLATIIYTSGTSGRPRGVMLSHGNLMHQVEYADAVIQPKPGQKCLSILPTWHSFERSCEYFLLSRATTLIYTDRRSIKKDFTQENPDYLIAVPRIWENVYEGIQKQFDAKSPALRKLILALIKASENSVMAKRIATNRSIQHYHLNGLQRLLAGIQHIALLPLHKLANILVFSKVRKALGTQFKSAFSGGGSFPAYLDLFYEAAGITIINGYGLTETSPIVAARRISNNLRGTVGPALPLTEFQIVDPETLRPLPRGQKGVIRVRGPQIMQGYYKNPEATAKAISEEGWFNTGDLGWLTPDNQLVITGRAKDTIVLINGENIEPQPLEDVCLQSPYIDQIIIVGQDQKRLGALIHPNIETLTAWAKEQKLAEVNLLANPKVKDLIMAELRQRIRNRPGYRPDDQVGDFRFLPEPMGVENGLMTQTLKLRRNVIAERYQHLIAEIFAD